MKVAIMQPYFLPYIGYWQLIKAVDKYVIYDDVNYIKRGWINRNNILMGGEKKLFTITLNGSSQNKLINEIEISDDFRKFMKTIQQHYIRAPYYGDILPLIEKIVSFETRCLSVFITNSIKSILSYLSVDTEILISSQLVKDCSLNGKDKIINICKNLGADSYYNAIGGQEMYNKDECANHGIDLRFLKTKIVSYKQFKNEFVPSLSILDVLMFNSVGEINIMLDSFELI
jgi:hypothetical protein